jgi:hypothetical protein
MLLYVDDIAIIGKNRNELQECLKGKLACIRHNRYLFNLKKCEYVTKTTFLEPFKMMERELLMQVKQFPYLGVIFDAHGIN